MNTRGNGQIGLRGARAHLHGDRIGGGLLGDQVPMYQAGIFDVHIQPRAHTQIGLALDDGNPNLDGRLMRIGQVDEAFEVEVEHRAGRRGLPAHRAREHAVAQIQPAPIAQYLAAIQAEAHAVRPDVHPPPTRQVGQLGEVDRHVVPHAMHEAGRVLAGVTLFEAAAHAEIAVADGEDRFLVALTIGLEGRFGHGPGGRFQAGADVGQGDAGERIEAHMRVPHPLGRPQADRPHAGGQRRVHSGGRIFDHRAERGRHVQQLGSLQEDVWRGLAAPHQMAVHYGIEQGGDAQAFDYGRRVAAHRADADLEARGAYLFQQLQCARQQIGRAQLAEHLGVVAVLAVGHPCDLGLGGRSARQDDLQRFAAAYPAQLFVDLAIEGQPFFVGQALPRPIVIFGGVSDHAVQVEDDSP